MTAIRIDLFSDTKTRPSAGMRQAMAEAEVGDEQSGEDPTTLALNERVADLLGKEAAVFLPSGTMCNEIAIAVHCRPGEEVIADRTAHIIGFEGGGPAAIAGVMINAVDGRRGMFSAEQAEAAVRTPANRYFPRSKLICVEQTSNLGGGAVWPLTQLQSITEVGRKHGLALHMDGARLFNAVAASNVTAKDMADCVDTAWIDLSKGLGCPVGAVLAGPRDFIDEVWWWKQRMGGALRQSGILAAAGLYALEHNVARLADDHANARILAEGLAALPGIALDPATVETNLFYFDVAETGLTAAQVNEKLAPNGIRFSAMGPTLLRAVTHLDVDEAGVREAVKVMGDIVGG